jgi:ribonuclease HI
MALRSAIEGLMLLRRPCRIVFTSDSQYLVHGMRKWIHGWARRGWKRKSGPIENEDLWRALAAESARHAVDWRWVRGHDGHPQNEYANDLAVQAAREQTRSGGFVESGFLAWLEHKRQSKGLYREFIEADRPTDDRFEPVPEVPA